MYTMLYFAHDFKDCAKTMSLSSIFSKKSILQWQPSCDKLCLRGFVAGSFKLSHPISVSHLVENLSCIAGAPWNPPFCGS